MTDVNIAVRMLEDAVDGLFDRAYVITADVDIVPAIHAVLRRAPDSQVVALLPPQSVVAEEFAILERSFPRRSVARHLNLDKLKRFPDDLPRRWGMILPEHWLEHAGKRPLHPRSSNGPARRVRWFEESV